MAYHDDDNCMWPQEHTPSGYALPSYQDSVSFSGYKSYNFSTHDQPKFIDYTYTYSSAYPEVNYFEYKFTEPKLIAYEPTACETGYVSYHVHNSISYSKRDIDTGFNEPEFEDYDPTPYGGGYNIVSQYGKPLPPSDQTCYPRSTQKPIQTEPDSKPMSKLEPQPKPMLPEPEPKPMLHELEPVPAHVTEPCDYGYDYTWPEYESTVVGYDYGYGKQVVQVPPCEYNPEVVDLCENIFGSWPCLARIRKQQMGIDSNQRIASNNPVKRDHNPWEGCANYIFGGPIASYYQ